MFNTTDIENKQHIHNKISQIADTMYIFCTNQKKFSAKKRIISDVKIYENQIQRPS